MKQHYDVVIMGSGLAGSCLARQLRLEQPELSVLCLEKSKEVSDGKVGEAIVELSSDYLSHKLGLLKYMHQNQVQKNGLRFYYNSKDRNLPLEKMTEMGTTVFPAHTTFTFDRVSLETDLIRMNREMGVDLLTGALVKDICVAEGEENNEVEFTYNEELQKVSCRWLIDATGRRQLLLKRLGREIVRDQRMNTSATWGRFEGLRDWDGAEVSQDWRKRAKNTTRGVSVNTIMGEGYWIWFIALPEDKTSVGVVFDNNICKDKLRTQEEFQTFLRSHKAIADILEDSKQLDHKHFKGLSYYTDEFYSMDRWGLTGDSSAFLDPFYSPGTDFIAVANELLASMIQSDFEGDEKRLKKKVTQYNIHFKDRYERAMRIYQDNYKFFSNFRVMMKKYFIDINHYFNVYYWPFLKDQTRKLSWINRSNRRNEMAQKILDTQMRMLTSYDQFLQKKGNYWQDNEGCFFNISPSTARHNKLVDQPFNETLSTNYLVETMAMAIFSIMGEMHEIPRLRKLPKRLASSMSLDQLVEWDVEDKGRIDSLIEMALENLRSDLQKEFPESEIYDLRPVDKADPLGALKVKNANGVWVEKSPLVAIANSCWQETIHPEGDIYLGSQLASEKPKPAEVKSIEIMTDAVIELSEKAGGA